MWAIRAHTRNIFFPLYEVWGPLKRGGGAGIPTPWTPPPPVSAPAFIYIVLYILN